MSNSINRRQLPASATCGATAAVAGGVLSADVARAAPSTYTPDWNSVDQHPPARVWFQDANGQPSVWPYHNLINGARDLTGNTVKFAPELKSAGGKFDPDEWVQLFVDAGIRFAGPVAEDHDGFSM